MSELDQNDDLGMGLPDDSQQPEGNEGKAAEPAKGGKAKKPKPPKGNKKPLPKPVKIGLLAVGGLVGLIVLLGVVGSVMSPSGPSPEEVRQAEIRRQAQANNNQANNNVDQQQANDLDSFDMDFDNASTDDFGLPRPTANEPTRLDTVDRNLDDHITYPMDEGLRDAYYKDGFNEIPVLDPPVRNVYIEADNHQPEFSHSEGECLWIIERSGEGLSIPEHDYCLSMVERRVARQAALRSLKYMEKPVEYWIEMKRPNIEVDIPEPIVQQSVQQSQVQQSQTNKATKVVPTVDYSSLYYLVDIIGDTAVLRGGNTGRMFEFKEGSKLAYNGVLEKIEGDTVHLRFGQKSVPLALWGQSGF